MRAIAPTLVTILLALFSSQALAQGEFAGRRVLWVDSYHKGFEWSDGIERGIESGFRDTGVELRTMHLNTKRDQDESHMLAAGRQALALTEAFAPHVVIASDDNAQKYYVVPFLRGGNTPVVFCGVNWDASMYGYPTTNVTGMLEVNLVNELVAHLSRHAKGPRIGYLSGDVETEHKIMDVYNKRFFNGTLQPFLAKDFEAFARLARRASSEVDMLVVGNYGGIEGFDPDAAEALMAAEVKVPTGCFDSYMSRYVIYTLSKTPEEQGQWSAETALRILSGTRPADIPMTANRQANLIINMRMAKAVGIVVPLSVLKTAEILK